MDDPPGVQHWGSSRMASLMICRDRDVSPDDTIETVYVRNSRNRLQAKLFIYSRYDVIYTVCLWQMLIGD